MPYCYIKLWVSIFLSWCGTVNGVDFLTIDVDTALEKAMATEKDVFIYFSADWCAPCQWMEENTFEDELVTFWLQERFVAVKADIETPMGAKIQRDYKVKAVPAMIFLDQAGNLLKQINTSVDAKELRDAIREVTQSAQRKDQIEKLKPPAYQLKKDRNLTRPPLVPERPVIAKPTIKPQPPARQEAFNYQQTQTYVVPRRPVTYQIDFGRVEHYNMAVKRVIRIEQIIQQKIEIIPEPNGEQMTYSLRISKVEDKAKAEQYQKQLSLLGIKTTIKQNDEVK